MGGRGAEYYHALEVYQEMELPSGQAETMAHIGEMHRQATQYDDAFNAFEEARQIYRQSGDRLHEGSMIEQRGQVQGDRELWDQALDEYQTALHLYSDINARMAKVAVYRSMERAVQNAKLRQADEVAEEGERHITAGEWVDAENAFREALAL